MTLTYLFLINVCQVETFLSLIPLYILHTHTITTVSLDIIADTSRQASKHCAILVFCWREQSSYFAAVA